MAQVSEPVAQAPEDLRGDGAVLKTILVEGTGETAGRGAKVGVRYSLRLSEEDDTEPFDSSAKRRDGVLEFTLGRAKVIPALEVVVNSMKMGEKCKARSTAPYAFGARGLKRKGVPPHADVYLEVEMVRCEGGEKKKPLADMSPKERFEEAKSCKEVGNNFFKEQKYEKALEKYGQSIRFLANVFYKPSSTLSDSVATPVGQKSPDETQASKDSAQEPEKEEGFQEAQVVDEEANGPAPSNKSETTQDQKSAAPQQPPVVEGEDVSSSPNGLVPNEEARPSLEKTNAVEQEDEDVVETIDVSTSTGNIQEADSKASGPEPVQGDGSAANVAKPDGEEAIPAPEGPAGPATQTDDTLESDDPEETEVRALHVTTLNNLSLCYVKLEEYRRAVDSATLALRLDSESSKAFYYRYVCTMSILLQAIRRKGRNQCISNHIFNMFACARLRS